VWLDPVTKRQMATRYIWAFEDGPTQDDLMPCPETGHGVYCERNKIERFFGRLKASFRRITTRYEKTSRNFLSMIKLASVRLWIEFYESAA
jgi:transposase